jgi:hypothetical protein
MSTSGVTSGQAAGTFQAFLAKHGVLQIPDYTMSQAATAGALVKAKTDAPQDLQLTVGGETVVEGILGDSVIDPSTLPADVAQRIYAAGILTDTFTNSPVSVWRVGRFFLTNVSGSVAYGDFLEPDTAVPGNVKSAGAANPLLNGSIRCLQPNSVAGGPIEVWENIG